MLNRGLQALLNSSDPSGFVKNCYPHDLLVTKGPAERLAELVGYTLDDLMVMKKAFTRTSFWSLDGHQHQMNIDSADARKCFDAGMTVYFHEISWPRTDLWLRAVEEELELLPNSTSLSAFAAHRGRGLPFHWDENSNFICQSVGTKRFRIAPNRIIKNPSSGHMIHHVPSERVRAEAEGKEIPTSLEPTQTVTMEPGMVMFMPKGMWHETETVANTSIHFNIQTRWPKWSDAMRMLVDETPAVYAEEVFREGIPAGLSESEFSDMLFRRLDDFCISVREKNMHRRVYEKFKRVRA